MGRNNMTLLQTTGEAVIIKLPEVLALTKISKSTLYRFMESGDFPRPIRLGKRARAWRKTDIEEWLETREEA